MPRKASGSFCDLVNTSDQARREVASNAQDASNKLQQSVDSQKTQLYGLNSSSADPSLASEQALSSANSLQTPGAFSPPGNVFAGVINAGTNYLNGQGKALPPGYGNAFALSRQGLRYQRVRADPVLWCRRDEVRGHSAHSHLTIVATVIALSPY